jgi:dihydrofolate reductase
MIKLIVCAGPNGELGLNNELIYHNKRDMKFFREQTRENIVIMGKNTFKSIGSKPLPDRINIVLTEETGFYPGVLTWNMPLENALRTAKAWFPMLDIYIIGGAYVYNQAIEQKLADEMLLTQMYQRKEADTFIDMTKINENYYVEDLVEILSDEDDMAIIYKLVRREED